MKKKPNIIIKATVFISLSLFVASCQKNINNQEMKFESHTSLNDVNTTLNDLTANNGVALNEMALSITIYNPCCQEEVRLTGIIHQVENSNVIHMDSRDISGIGVTSGFHYTVQSTSVRNYQFDPNEYLATLNWSMRMNREDGCGYNVQFVIHVTRDENGDIKASIHSGNFFCL